MKQIAGLLFDQPSAESLVDLILQARLFISFFSLKILWKKIPVETSASVSMLETRRRLSGLSIFLLMDATHHALCPDYSSF